MTKNFIYLVDLNQKTISGIGRAINVDWDNLEDTIRPYCDLHINEMKSGNIIFIAENIDGELRTEFRASYGAEWMESDEKGYPYFFDVAEHDERVTFDCILSGRDWE